MNEITDKIIQDQNDGNRKNHEPEALNIGQWFQAEGEDPLFRPLNVFQKIVCAAPEHAFRSGVGHSRLLESDPSAQAADEIVVFTKTEQMFNRLSVNQRKIAGIDGYIHV